MHEPPCNLPRELKACTEKFTMWYKNQNSNKQLNWLYSNGSVELIVLYTPKKYQLIVNVFQAAILCMFNDADNITVGQLKSTTTMPRENF